MHKMLTAGAAEGSLDSVEITRVGAGTESVAIRAPLTWRSVRRESRPVGELKRYSLVLPEELLDQVKELADIRHTTVVEMLRKFIRIGLLVANVDDDPAAALILREGDRERELVLL